MTGPKVMQLPTAFKADVHLRCNSMSKDLALWRPLDFFATAATVRGSIELKSQSAGWS